MHKIALFFLFLPLFSTAQVYDVVVEEEWSTEEAFKKTIPKHLKNGKPQYFRYQNLGGFILNDSVLIPCKYEELDTKYADFMICREPRKRYGAINKKGETVLPFEYNALSHAPGGALFAWKDKSGYGLLNQAGKALVPMEYNRGAFIRDSIYVFYSPGKQRFVKVQDSTRVTVLLDATFEDISLDAAGNKLFFAVKQQGLWGLMNLQQQLLVPCAYERIVAVGNGHAIVSRAGKKGVVDFQGREFIPCQFGEIQPQLKNGLFVFREKISPVKTICGLVDTTGKIILPAEYETIAGLYYNNNLKVSKNGKYGIVTPTGQFLTKLQFQKIQEWKHHVWEQKTTDSGGKGWGIKDDQYGIYYVYGDVENGKVGLWHIEKGQVLPAQFDYFHIYLPNGPIIVSRDDKQACYSLDGKQLVDFQYNSLGVLTPDHQYLSAHISDKRTLVSPRTGKQIQPEYYDDWIFVYRWDMDGYFYTKMGIKLALHAPDGRRLTPHQYRIGIRPCPELPEVTAKLPSGRKLIAATFKEVDGRYVHVALDDTGAEYEYEEKK